MKLEVDEFLTPYVVNLPTSRPIFTAKVGEDGQYVTVDVVNKLYNLKAPTQDPIDIMAHVFHEEGFDKPLGVFRIREQAVKSMICSSVIESLRSFVHRYSDNKKPQLTATYKWLRAQNNNSDSMLGLMLLYKYLRENSKNNSLILDKNDPHIKNGMLILEKMRTKYEKSNS